MSCGCWGGGCWGGGCGGEDRVEDRVEGRVGRERRRRRFWKGKGGEMG